MKSIPKSQTEHAFHKELGFFLVRSAETTGQFVFSDADLCPLVRYLGVSIVKGDSLEIRTLDLGPVASKTRLVPITANCQPSEYSPSYAQ